MCGYYTTDTGIGQMSDYEIEVNGKTYELHSDKRLDKAGMQRIVSDFKKKAGGGSVSTLSGRGQLSPSATSATSQKHRQQNTTKSSADSNTSQKSQPGIDKKPQLKEQARAEIAKQTEQAADQRRVRQSENSAAGLRINEAARRLGNLDIVGALKSVRPGDFNPLGGLQEVAQPVEQGLSALVGRLRQMGGSYQQQSTPLQKEIDRQTNKLPVGRQIASQPGVFAQMNPQFSRYLDRPSKTGIEAATKGLGRGVRGLATVDNAVIGAALAPAEAAGAVGAIVKAAATGAFGAEAAHGINEGWQKYENSGRKNKDALADAAVNALFMGLLATHGAKEALKMRDAALKTGNPVVELTKAAAKDPLAATEPKPTPEPEKARTAPKQGTSLKTARPKPKAASQEPRTADLGQKVGNTPDPQKPQSVAPVKTEAIAQPVDETPKPAKPVKTPKEAQNGPKQAAPAAKDKEAAKGKAVVKPEQAAPQAKSEPVKEQTNAVQEQIAAPGVPRRPRSKVELQGVGEGDKGKEAAGKGQEEKVAVSKTNTKVSEKRLYMGDPVTVVEYTQNGNAVIRGASRGGKLITVSQHQLSDIPNPKPEVHPAEALPAAKGKTTITPDEAATLAGYYPKGHAVGDLMDDYARRNNKVPISEDAADAMRAVIEQKKLDKGQFPSLYPDFKAKADRYGRRSAKDTAVAEKGPQELGTFNPLRALIGDERYEAANEGLSRLAKGTYVTINPYGLDPTAHQSALIGREHLARMANEAVRRVHDLKVVRNAFDKIAARTPGAAARFMFNMEAGNTHADPAAQQYGNIFRKALDDKTAEVQALGTGALNNYIQDYFPHAWKNPEQAARMFGEGRAALEGSKKFLHQRTIPTIEQGMFPQGAPANLDTMSLKDIKAEVKRQGGLEPLSYNPAEMVQLKLQEMDRFIMGQKWAAEMKATGLAKSSMKFSNEQKGRVKAGQPAGDMIPDGWVPLNDKMFKIVEHRKTANGGTEKVEHGQWYAPEGAARIINNYLTPGFANHPTMGPGYRAIRAGANMLVQAKLGLSGFHWTGESINAMISGGAKSLQETSTGDFKAAAKSGVTAASGVGTPIKYYVDGRKLFAEALKPGSQPAKYAAMLDYLNKAGGRLEMPHEFRVGAMESFGKAYRQMDVRGMALNTPFAIAEGTMAPLMRHAVPRLKLGAFTDMMSTEIDRLGPSATIEQQREAAARIWDSVENRFGELSYDNLFWDNTFKDIVHLTTMAPGWNLGTAREIGGGIKDVLTTRSRLRSGGRALTERTAFALSLVGGTAYLGYIYNKLHGNNPKTLEDLFFPVGPDGKRVQLPTYMRDVHGFATAPLKTIGNKLHPALSLVWETLHGKDYYGKPITENLDEYMKYLRKQIVPISMKTKGEESEIEAMKNALSTPEGRERLMGITPVAGQGTPKEKQSSNPLGSSRSLLPSVR